MDIDEQIKFEQTQVQCEEIEKWLKTQPLVSDIIPFNVLFDDCGEGFMSKFKELASKYRGVRRIRGDGNCFYRGFCFSLVENLVLKKLKDEALKLRSRSQKCREILVELNYPSLTIEDFEENFIDVLDELVINGLGTVEEVHKLFNDEARSNYFVVFMRLMVSAYIQSHSEDYAGIIPGSLNEWCKNEVEPVNRDADCIHVAALALATGFDILVENCQLSGTLNKLVFPGTLNESNNEDKIFIKLLYQPGHYNVLY